MFNSTRDQSFLGFVTVLVSVVVLTLVAWFFLPSGVEAVITAKTRLMDQSVGGLIAILGMAAQAVFRHSQTDMDVAAAAKATAEKIPPLTGEAKEEQKSDDSNPTG